MSHKDIIKQLNYTLGLSRNIVGIKFIFTKEEFDSLDIKQVNYKMSYCNTVKLASKGKSFKANSDNFLCKASSRALGLMDVDNEVVSGRLYHSFNMYRSVGIAKNVQRNVTYVDHKIYGVVVGPLKEIEIKPDVIIMITNPYQAMRIVQGYSYDCGIPTNIKFTGNQGVCSECTATPYENNDINVSLLCANTRFAAKWDDNEMGIGMPYHIFETIANGIIKTLNPSEPNIKKRKIIEQIGIENIAIPIELGTSYYKSGK
ncbi:DUF169 domain-containing protein [Natronincola ferrireducens]|uniref:Uncharacterized conserved protein, DUF169 family n=1 Tax=Natronincola ferrireducens TaxID=393762 RepID=A0A1G9CKV6_9FIRM|nr:DUF169 domain-containing protein [Natronincola ferrireducens]SDK52321.1 Uncharacterized conserved protein, DUF169 family [Natronincola ferrireducens]